MRKQYWIIDPEESGSLEGSKEAIGPFRSVREAEKWLVQHHSELVDSSDGSFFDRLGEQAGWAAPVLIVQQIKTVHPVPFVSAKVKLKEVKEIK